MPNARKQDDLLKTLQTRFETHAHRHPGTSWSDVLERLQAQPETLRALREMERTGGEPDVVGRDPKTGRYILVDCSEESPSGRRSLCYDAAALKSRKENRPAGSALEAAAAMGVELLTEDEYGAQSHWAARGFRGTLRV